MSYKPVHAWLSKNSRSRFLRLFPCVLWIVAKPRKRYILQKKCLNGQIGTCLLGTSWYNFLPCIHRPWEPQCTVLQKDGQTRQTTWRCQ